jgi:hypothetical protein
MALQEPDAESNLLFKGGGRYLSVFAADEMIPVGNKENPGDLVVRAFIHRQVAR